ncbi:MAG TPA: hydrogenase maturation nickel metallochaperone HypA [Candidatus Limnocylindria bacterium]|nr:hydrogenase maturation nickel metallochaperone HypA [Candidatus Limnocylindria bacterium]
MHEVGIAEGILAVAIDAAGGERVERVRVRIGSLHRVTLDSLRFSFELVSRDTGAANAVLELDEVRARVRCRRCASEGAMDTDALACRGCGAVDVEVTAGTELVVDAVKVAGAWRRRPRMRRLTTEVS